MQMCIRDRVPCLRLGVLFIQALEVRGLCPGLHAYAEAVAPVAVFRKFVCVSLWHGYLAPELDRAHEMCIRDSLYEKETITGEEFMQILKQ